MVDRTVRLFKPCRALSPDLEDLFFEPVPFFV